MLVVFLCCAAAHGPSQSDRYLPGDAKFLMGVEVRRLMQSPMDDVIKRDFTPEPAREASAS